MPHLRTDAISFLRMPPLQADANSVPASLSQTDASINGGNSGGPVFDSGGRVVSGVWKGRGGGAAVDMSSLAFIRFLLHPLLATP